MQIGISGEFAVSQAPILDGDAFDSRMRDTSFVVSPIRDHAFLSSRKLERLFGDDLLQRRGLAAQPLDLVGGGGTGRVAR
jgi:hypothetical protein